MEEPSFWVYGKEYGEKNLVIKARMRYYHEAVNCMRPLTHCGGESFFQSVTSGLRYMCVEQKDAFDMLINCVDINSGLVRRDCDLQCHPNTLATGLALKDTFMTQLDHPLVSQNLNMRKLLEPHMSRLFFSEGCRIAQCLMGCYRTKYNMLCEGSAGSLLMEMLTRPFSSRESSSELQLSSFLGGLLPHQCSFLTASGGRWGFRIDPELDKEIKRMYNNKKITSQETSKSANQKIDIVNPFLHSYNSYHRNSPLEFDSKHSNELVETRMQQEENSLDFESSGIDAFSEDYSSGLMKAHDTSVWSEIQYSSGEEVELPTAETKIGYQDPTVIQLERTADNADLFLAHRIEADKNYNVVVNVDKDDEGELVCVLRTDKAFGVNRVMYDVPSFKEV
uniref:CPG4 domain-containing protein n=1 Tax=Heterorhabditis bacteriophora TaxID=37862 RepID=A0A1I7XKQ3_HETBA